MTLLKVLHLAQDNREIFYSKKNRNNALMSAGFSQDVLEGITDYFVPDCTNDGTTYAITYKYDLVYFDSAGVKHAVIVQR